MNSNSPINYAIDDATYVVVFNATLTSEQTGYRAASKLLAGRVKKYPGFILEESFSDGDRTISVTYWRDLESIRSWREDPEHKSIQAEAVKRWYLAYSVFVCEVSRAYEFPGPKARHAS